MPFVYLLLFNYLLREHKISYFLVCTSLRLFGKLQIPLFEETVLLFEETVLPFEETVPLFEETFPLFEETVPLFEETVPLF